MMKIPINLASQPFRRDRAMLVASVAVAVLLLVSLAALVTLTNTDNAQMADVRKDVTQLKAQIAAVSKQQAEFDAVIRKPENAEVLERSVFLNTLLDRKGISWTRILGDLEKIMPPNVKMLNIQPYVTGQNQITLNLQVGSESGEPVIEFYRALESSKLFDILGQPIFNPPSQAEPLYRYRITVNYAQKL
jgi:type IV pilus assembly protein PilN